MDKKKGRPPSATAKVEHLQIRLDAAEKQAFAAAAALAGQSVSVWVRDRLRRIARQELEEAGLPVAYMARRVSSEADHAAREKSESTS